MKAGLKCLKYLMFFGNLIIFLLGGALLGIGIYSYVRGEKLSGLALSVNSKQVEIAIIALGGVVMLLAFFGCCGAGIESKFLLSVFFVFILLLMLAELGVGIAGYVKRNDMESDLNSAWNKSSNETKVDIQNNFNCCGFNDFSQAILPCNYNSTCYKKVKDDISNNLYIVGVAGITVACIQFLSLIFAGCLIHGLGAEQKEEEKRKLMEDTRGVNRGVQVPRGAYV